MNFWSSEEDILEAQVQTYLWMTLQCVQKKVDEMINQSCVGIVEEHKWFFWVFYVATDVCLPQCSNQGKLCKFSVNAAAIWTSWVNIKLRWRTPEQEEKNESVTSWAWRRYRGNWVSTKTTASDHVQTRRSSSNITEGLKLLFND